MKDKQEKVNAYLSMLDETMGTREFTLLDLISEMSLNLSKSQKSRLGLIISGFARETGIKYTKVLQTENNHVLPVNSYPLDSKHLIKSEITRFLGTMIPGSKPRKKRKRIRYQKV